MILEKRLSMRAAATLLGVHVATLWRWAQRGVRGRKLGTIYIGGRRYVLERDLTEFVEAANAPAAMRLPSVRERAVAAGEELEKQLG